MLGEYGLAGGPGVDVGVAIAVTADPAAEAQHGRQVDAAEIGMIPVGTVDGAFQAAVDHWDGIEQRLFEVMHTHAYLVPHIGPRGADLVGFPQRLDVGAQIAGMHLFVIDRGRRGVECIVALEYAACLQHDGAAFRLGRVCGEHRHVADLFEQVLQLVRIHPHVAQVTQTGVERALPQDAAGGCDPAALAMLKTLFGVVYQLEIDAEGADDRSQGVRRKLADKFLQACQAYRVGLVA